MRILEELGLEWLAVAGGAVVTLLVTALAFYWIIRERRLARTTRPISDTASPEQSAPPPEQPPQE